MGARASHALAGVKVAMVEAASRAERRRLVVLGDSSPCRKGCSACCSRMVRVTVAEAAVMLEHLERAGTWREVREAAREQARIAMAAADRSWFMMNIPCPVLDRGTGECRAYPVRPTPCSAHYVTSDPSLCDPWSTRAGEYRPEPDVEAHEAFLRALEREVDGYGVLALRLPVPAALLLAERIKDVGDSAEQIASFVRTELA